MSSPTWLSCRLALRLGSAGSSARASRLGGCRCLLLLLRRRLSALRRGPRPENGLWLPPAASCLGSPRPLGTHPKKEPMEALNTAQGARDFIYSLHSTERSCLLRELHRFESIAIAQGEGPASGEAEERPCTCERAREPCRLPRPIHPFGGGIVSNTHLLGGAGDQRECRPGKACFGCVCVCAHPACRLAFLGSRVNTCTRAVPEMETKKRD